MKRVLVKTALALVIALVTTEVALHVFPALLPRSYLSAFPGHGTEFFHPDVFERTPVEGVLLPHLVGSHREPEPADLVELGVAPRSEGDAPRPFLYLPADALGFPNLRASERCELLLVGDSFGVAAGAREPEGLQVALERATGLPVYNLSVAGIGPAQERWLVQSRGLSLEPRAVLWLYYSGNDLTASYEPFLARRDGHATWAEAWPERRKPLLYLPDWIRRSRQRPEPPSREAQEGFAFPQADGSTRSIWFEPETLRQLGWSRVEWEAHPAWAPVQGELRAARDACAARGVRFFLLYAPAKPEVLLPFVARDPALARRAIGAYGTPPAESDDEVLYEMLLAHRHAHEEMVRDFCTREAIPFLSATPSLEAQASRGELGYVAADTHWHTNGQLAFLEPLLAFLREQGVLP